ncbi:MAG: M61 family metallopeptidase [Methylophilaceae bacterium]
MSSIKYQVSLHAPQTHLFEIQCTITHPAPNGQVFSLPAWIPGSYLVRDFARHVVNISATASGKVIALTKLDKNTWQSAPCSGALTLSYQVYAYDLSVRTAYLDHQRAYFNGTSLFMRIADQDHLACEVSIEAPAKSFKHWQVATTMPAIKVNKSGYGSYRAANYAELIDFPVEIGELTIGEFKAGGVPHRIVISGKHQTDIKRIARDLKTLCDYHIRFFGKAPFKRYDFLLYAAADNQYGGLEHSNSTSLICPRSWLPVKNETVDESSYQDFLGLCSHEYFHAWHVKRIRPQVFADPDLGREAYTRLLWVFEGFTAYYDTLALVRAGLMSQEEYLKSLSKDITRFLRTPGRKIQALDESSFDTWIKLYKPDENTPNAQISYYLKGSLVALAIDLTLRLKGRALDEIMHSLWRRYSQDKQLVEEHEIQSLIQQVTGQNLSKLFKLCVHGTEDPPLKNLFSKFGITFEPDKADINVLRESLGLQLANESETRISNVFSGSAAEKSGLAAGDVLLALDNLKLTAKSLKDIVKKKMEGSKFLIHFFRRDELITCELVKETKALESCDLKIKADAKPETIALREAWFKGS